MSTTFIDSVTAAMTAVLPRGGTRVGSVSGPVPGGDDVPEEEKGLARRNINISYIAYKHTTGMRINLRFTVILSQIKPPGNGLRASYEGVSDIREHPKPMISPRASPLEPVQRYGSSELRGRRSTVDGFREIRLEFSFLKEKDSNVSTNVLLAFDEISTSMYRVTKNRNKRLVLEKM
uniref:Uncharacterized protein n=1 Tax=Vespula pensylvanica TaxID=30213 RepID=A0A834P5Z1_VESPE|nr:hypothetical protein H0235_006030 [Vespula pensylvanica]